jgi:arylsulfatase A-like enzyme
MSRPNILLISADQHRADCLGIAGRAVKTPNLDALARAGTRFTNCITPTVVCQPARASILTGQLCRTHGVHDNGIDLDPAIGEPGFAGSLASTGYRTAYFGKAHFSTYHTYQPTGTPECLRSSASYDDQWFGPYMGFQHVELMLVGHNWFPPETPPAGQHYERFYHQDGQGAARTEAYWRNGGDTKGAAQTWHSQLPEEYHNSTWTADRAISFLNEADPETPFMAWVSFPDPHHPFDAPEPWSRLHDPELVDLPPHRNRDFENRPWWHEAVLTRRPEGSAETAELRTNYSRIPEQSDDQLREIIANTYGQLALIDHNVGRILSTLDRAGLADNTIVIYISDHGDWLGDHGLILKGPMHYDGLLKVPMIVRGPGIPIDKVDDTPVSTIDLCPTFCDWAGAKPGLAQHGRSLKPVMNGDEDREFAMNEWHLLPTRAGVELQLQTVRTRNAKLTVDRISGDGEYYDLDRDPYELTNLFSHQSSAALRSKLFSFLDLRPDDMRPVQEQVGIA